ncbi:MAG: chemotaxis protein CheA [bacterium]|nr:MAG: chemotaxis protein CheA [bacterium]
MDMSKYKDLFISEAREHLQGINNCILVLEKDAQAVDSINELFRHAHSIKGMAASMGYGKISELSHHLEDMMDVFRRGPARITPAVVDLLFSGIDHLEEMVSAVEKDASFDDIDTAPYVAQIQKVIDGEMPGVEDEKAGEEAGIAADESAVEIPAKEFPSLAREDVLVNFRIAEDCPVPNARAYLAIKRLESAGTVKLVQPPVDSVKAGDFDGEVTVVLSGADSQDVRGILENCAEMGEIIVQAAADLEVKKKPVKPPEKERTPPAAAAEKEAPAPAAPPVADPVESGRAAKTSGAKTVRISTALLDTFINLVGELIVTKSRLKDLVQDLGTTTSEQVMTRLDHLVGGLHTEVMKVRMDPLESVTQRLPRAVRDLARKAGKEVVLEIEGSEIELDRAILDELGDPLIHILRNSVDHGIEKASERKKAGKDATGHIRIVAYRERDMVHVEISDDGRGMDLEKIRGKAVERGIITSDQARLMGEEETIMLICRPGFSTADEVTDVSGRGVGMDVVQSVVEGLGGTLSIHSVTGQGTNFTLKLPLTVAIVKMLLVHLLEHVFAIPITRVVRTVSVELEEVQESQGRFYLTVDEDLVPLFELRKLLNLPGSLKDRPLLTVVLVEVTNRVVGIAVDGVSGQEDIVIKPLCFPLQYLTRYSGMTVLGDGRIVPILDLGNLF